jgi:hypothetical protein
VLNIDSPPLSVLVNIPTIGIGAGSFRNNLTIGRKIMDIHEVYSADGVSLFNGSNFSHWRIRMRSFLQAHGFDIWKSVLDGYTTPKGIPKGATTKNIHKENAIALNIIMRGLSKSQKKIN